MAHVVAVLAWVRLACRLVGLSRSALCRPFKADTLDDPDQALEGGILDQRATLNAGVCNARRLCWPTQSLKTGHGSIAAQTKTPARVTRTVAPARATSFQRSSKYDR